jgi:uncharacterized membrane protein
MLWLAGLIQWVHILAGATWFGSNVFASFVVAPAIGHLPFEQQKAFFKFYHKNIVLLLSPTSLIVVIAGILRGTLFGPIQSFEFLFTNPYGLTFLLSCILGIALIFWGAVVMSQNVQKIQQFSLPDGRPTPELLAQMRKLQLLGTIEIAVFLILLVCMVLMRFSL